MDLMYPLYLSTHHLCYWNMYHVTACDCHVISCDCQMIVTNVILYLDNFLTTQKLVTCLIHVIKDVTLT